MLFSYFKNIEKILINQFYLFLNHVKDLSFLMLNNKYSPRAMRYKLILLFFREIKEYLNYMIVVSLSY
jgi:hypothetical protein